MYEYVILVIKGQFAVTNSDFKIRSCEKGTGRFRLLSKELKTIQHFFK
jgi:hypothetical protein